MKLKVIFRLLKDTFAEWQEDKASRLAAALAYYTAFSIAPLLIIAIAIAALVFGEEAARGEIVAQLQGLVGREGAEAIQTMIENSRKPSEGTVATLVSLVILFFGASGVFGQLQESLNTIWEVAPKPKRGVTGMVKDRLPSFVMVLGIGFLLLVSLVLSAALAALGNYFGHVVPSLQSLWPAINFIFSFGIITVLFALIYKVLPDVKITWGDVWMGAGITSLLFVIGKALIGLYLGNSSVGSTYGAAGSFVVFLIWVYYSAQILFFGAEFTQVYANRYGSRIVPSENAIPLTEEARAQQGMPHSRYVEAIAAREEENRRPGSVGSRSGATTASTASPPPSSHQSPHPVAIGLSLLIGVYQSGARLLGFKRHRRQK